MKNKIVYKYIGKVLIVFSILLFFPIIISLIYKESLIPFIIPQAISLILGIILNSINTNKTIIYVKDGFKIVALSWIIISLIGALPMYLNKDAGFIDSLFEIISGFTTTGVTIFKDVEILNKSILFWRSFSQFIGGIGVLALIMAVIPLSKSDKSIQLLRAELSIPNVGKLVTGMRKTLIYTYAIYLSLTVFQIILLKVGGMDAFSSILISFTTAATGGFSILNTSIATYSTFCKYVIIIFMILFGVNFNIFFLIIMGNIRKALKSEELRVYIVTYICSVLFIFASTVTMFDNISQAFTEAAFHVSSVITSTGFSIGDINIYPTSCRLLMLVIMSVCACVGSTSGGIKIARIVVIYKTIKRELKKIIHPNSVQAITLDKKSLSEDIVRSNNMFFIIYLITVIVIIFIVSFDGFSLETTVNAVFTTFANVGLCFNISNFAEFSILSKLALSAGMILGRLEIFPILVLCSDWKKTSKVH